jgi:hypothetical protein
MPRRGGPKPLEEQTSGWPCLTRPFRRLLSERIKPGQRFSFYGPATRRRFRLHRSPKGIRPMEFLRFVERRPLRQAGGSRGLANQFEFGLVRHVLVTPAGGRTSSGHKRKDGQGRRRRTYKLAQDSPHDSRVWATALARICKRPMRKTSSTARRDICANAHLSEAIVGVIEIN